MMVIGPVHVLIWMETRDRSWNFGWAVPCTSAVQKSCTAKRGPAPGDAVLHLGPIGPSTMV